MKTSSSPALVRLSKRFSYALRHDPASFGLLLDPQGFVAVEHVLRALGASREDLANVLGQTEKKRLELSADGLRIRATHGHSVPVELPPNPTQGLPKDVLFHGTVAKFLPSIWERGLLAGSRQHVHLAETREAAVSVASRRGQPVILLVDALRLTQDGAPLHRSSSGVWLIEHVPPTYLALEKT
jgi:putative RNA 2'-phosphotransferase